jgi:hypothetical protein
MGDLQTRDVMILTDALTYIPFKHLTRTQVAELLGKSVSQVDYYARVGVKLSEGHHLKLERESNGTFYTSSVISFIEQIKSK